MLVNPIMMNTIRKNNTVTPQRAFVSQSIKLSSPKDSVSFGSNYELELETRTQNKRGDKTGWAWNWAGGYEKARNEVILEMENEAKQALIDLAASKATTAATEKHLEAMREAQEKLEVATAANKEAYKMAQAAKDETIVYSNKALEAANQLSEERQKLADTYAKLLEEQKVKTVENENVVEQLRKQMEEASKQNDIKTRELLDEQLKEVQRIHNKQMEDLENQMSNIKKTEATYKRLVDIENANGFGKIAGYKYEQKILVDNFGRAIELERNNEPASIPNGILFYGPKGCGKSTFADAFAGQLECKIVKVKNYMNDEKNLEKLTEQAEAAQQEFEKTNIRTVLLIDEFEDFVPKGSRLTNGMKTFMDNVSKMYHCTVFATTNHPDKIDDILLRDERIDVRVALAPATKENAVAVLAHYANGNTLPGVNYEELAEEIVNHPSEGAFSNSRIKGLVNRLIKANADTGKKLSQIDLSDAIKEAGPDISNKALELFMEQIQYVKKNL